MVGYGEHEPVHKTAILGQTVQFDCQTHFPDDIIVPYVVTWSKKGIKHEILYLNRTLNMVKKPIYFSIAFRPQRPNIGTGESAA